MTDEHPPGQPDPVKPPDEPDKIVLRKANERSFPCPHCNLPFNSKQALWYHLHQAQNDCREKEEAAQGAAAPADAAVRDPQPPQPRNTIAPVVMDLQQTPAADLLPRGEPVPAAKSMAASAPAAPLIGSLDDCREEGDLFDGDTPPVPMVLIYIIVLVMGLLVVVVVFWQQLWKLYKKIGGGDTDGGNPATDKQQ